MKLFRDEAVKVYLYLAVKSHPQSRVADLQNRVVPTKRVITYGI